ncbi:hypothetical protein F444_01312 [Phytophthora nicotianae P1976]|uniref:DDE Tnp4 domain-containing protein n=1 Tax=Phytophthora nicotianae P1976 TaxID=1317066 RepID=A0A081B114_PHYNI|nr:hypothetical protein F444_01312 [Phytophthora nicotianae P1976]
MAFGLLVCKWRVFKAPLEIGFKRVARTILAGCILHNWCINQHLCENGGYRVEEDDDLMEGIIRIEESGLQQDAPPDFSVAPQNASPYRQLYQSSDLNADTDTYNSSGWVREALVGLVEHDMVNRPQRNRARREREKNLHFSSVPTFNKIGWYQSLLLKLLR